MFTIFNIFCCSLLTNSEIVSLDSYKSLLKTLTEIQAFEVEGTDFYLSLSMIDHAGYVSQQNY